MVKTMCSQCRGPRSIPGQGTRFWVLKLGPGATKERKRYDYLKSNPPSHYKKISSLPPSSMHDRLPWSRKFKIICTEWSFGWGGLWNLFSVLLVGDNLACSPQSGRIQSWCLGAQVLSFFSARCY